MNKKIIFTVYTILTLLLGSITLAQADGGVFHFHGGTCPPSSKRLGGDGYANYGTVSLCQCNSGYSLQTGTGTDPNGAWTNATCIPPTCPPNSTLQTDSSNAYYLMCECNNNHFPKHVPPIKGTTPLTTMTSCTLASSSGNTSSSSSSGGSSSSSSSSGNPNSKPLCVGLYSSAIGATGTESANQWVTTEHGLVPTPDNIKKDTLRARATAQAQWEMYFVTDLSGNPINASLSAYGANQNLQTATADTLENLPHFALQSYVSKKYVRFDSTTGYFIADAPTPGDITTSFRVNNNTVNDNGNSYTNFYGKKYKDVLWSDAAGWMIANRKSKYPYVVQGTNGNVTPDNNVITIKPSIGNCDSFFWTKGSSSGNGEHFGY